MNIAKPVVEQNELEKIIFDYKMPNKKAIYPTKKDVKIVNSKIPGFEQDYTVFIKDMENYTLSVNIATIEPLNRHSKSCIGTISSTALGFLSYSITNSILLGITTFFLSNVVLDALGYSLPMKKDYGQFGREIGVDIVKHNSKLMKSTENILPKVTDFLNLDAKQTTLSAPMQLSFDEQYFNRIENLETTLNAIETKGIYLSDRMNSEIRHGIRNTHINLVSPTIKANIRF